MRTKKIESLYRSKVNEMNPPRQLDIIKSQLIFKEEPVKKSWFESLQVFKLSHIFMVIFTMSFSIILFNFYENSVNIETEAIHEYLELYTDAFIEIPILSENLSISEGYFQVYIGAINEEIVLIYFIDDFAEIKITDLNTNKATMINFSYGFINLDFQQSTTILFEVGTHENKTLYLEKEIFIDVEYYKALLLGA